MNRSSRSMLITWTLSPIWKSAAVWFEVCTGLFAAFLALVFSSCFLIRSLPASRSCMVIPFLAALLKSLIVSSAVSLASLKIASASSLAFSIMLSDFSSRRQFNFKAVLKFFNFFFIKFNFSLLFFYCNTAFFKVGNYIFKSFVRVPILALAFSMISEGSPSLPDIAKALLLPGIPIRSL